LHALLFSRAQTPESEEAVARLLADGALRFYAAGEDAHLRQAIDEVLRLDPRSAFQRSLSATARSRQSLPDAADAAAGDADTSAASAGAATFKVAFDSVEVEFAYPSHDAIRVLALRLRPPSASVDHEGEPQDDNADTSEQSQ
jgi:hypothetical protein